MSDSAAFATRRARLAERMQRNGLDLLIVPPSADLEYLTGMERRVPAFGNIAYAHGWVAGAFFAPGRDPLFVLPRMVAEFDAPGGVPGEVVVVREADNGEALFGHAAASFGPVRTLAIGARTWGEMVLHLIAALGGSSGEPVLVNGDTLLNPLRRVKSPEELALLERACQIADQAMAAVAERVQVGVTERDLAEEVDHQLRRHGSRTVSFDTGVFAIGRGVAGRDADVRVSERPLPPGIGVSFDFGAVVEGYCSDFGRTIFLGEPDEEFRRAYDLVIAAQAAGIAAVRPGVPAAAVHHACRQVIVEGGYGDWFRHRTGHCIGLDVHEHPFISEEDQTSLEPGMTFTIEPSIFWPGHVGTRIEDVIVCEQAGGRKLNHHPEALVANG
jgi:Xaa-Pro aminopeptidase